MDMSILAAKGEQNMVAPVYKKNNYNSMVMQELTIEKEGYDPYLLTPKSNKYIWVSCRYCGEPNRVKKSKYTISGNNNAHAECRKKELKEVDSSFSSEKTKQKIKNSLIEKYGVDHSSKIKETVEKRKESFIKRFGVDNPSKSEEIKEKKRIKSLEKYGCDHPMQNKEVYAKQAKTTLLKYGFLRPAQNNSIKEKMKKTFLTKYGYENPMQNGDIKNKSMSAFKMMVQNSPDRYKVVNCLRNNYLFWHDLSTMSLSDISVKYDVSYSTLQNALMSDQFSYLYKETYSYPKNQTQNEIFKEIKNITNLEVVNSDWKTISPYELDIYIPDKKIAIEFNGNLWHSEKFIDKDIASSKHYNKLQLCRSKGIYLLQIFEHQWKERKAQILNFIKTVLGENKINIAARKCKLTNTDAWSFLNNNHIQGGQNFVLKYFNLEYNGEIVATMTASRHHRQNTNQNTVILSRLCFKDEVNVQGGASKLFKYFIEWAKSEGYSSILSWSDNCWTEGNVYKILGFNFKKEYKPDYFYYDVNQHVVYQKQSQKKDRTGCPKNITERDFCLERGLYRVWDSGKKVWTFNL